MSRMWMKDSRLFYQPQLANEPEHIQLAIVNAGKELLKKYKDCWILATMQDDGYYILVIENGMPLTLPCAVYSVTPAAGAGKPEVKAIFDKN